MNLLIDNYDSFSYNLYQLIGTLDPAIKVIRNDELTVAEIAALKPEHIIISPGPGRPENAGVIIDVVRELSPSFPMLGVCLGHQAICAAFGATVSHAKHLMHGKQSLIQIDNSCEIFKGLPNEVKVARYHSLAAVRETMPECLKVVGATLDAEHEVMAVAHTSYPLYGVQFHPESILTPEGHLMMRNFLAL